MRTSAAIVMSVSLLTPGVFVGLASADQQQSGKQKQEQKRTKESEEKKQQSKQAGPMGEQHTGGAGPSGPSSGKHAQAPGHEGGK